MDLRFLVGWGWGKIFHRGGYRGHGWGKNWGYGGERRSFLRIFPSPLTILILPCLAFFSVVDVNSAIIPCKQGSFDWEMGDIVIIWLTKELHDRDSRWSIKLNQPMQDQGILWEPWNLFKSRPNEPSFNIVSWCIDCTNTKSDTICQQNIKNLVDHHN